MGPRARDDSTVELSLEQTVVAVALRDPHRALVADALADARFMVVSDVGVPSAGVVIGEAGSESVTALRTRARPDAAIVVVAPVASPELVRASLAAGAVACLRPPLVIEELVKVVQSALDTHAAKSQVADLARKLDLETHLASIGRMSAGLSHEISTPLLVAATNLEIARTELEQLSATTKREEIDAIRVSFEEMHRAHERLRRVLETMRELAGRRRAGRLDRVDLRRAAEDTMTLLTNQLKDLEVEIAGPPTFARADHVLLAQILENLVLNGAHAARSLPAPRVRLHTYVHEGRAIVSVRDNGPGIAPELHQKIFEPFFTTRRGRGGGTGLGLALCREYAVQMNADVTLWSVPGRGACFRVSFNPA